VSVAFVLLWLLSSAAPNAGKLHVGLDGYNLEFIRPSGWTSNVTDTRGIELWRNGAEITLDWYKPTRAMHYADFDRRIAAEIRDLREDHRPVHAQHRRIGVLRAVEVRCLDHESVFAETFVDVPREPSGGDLFVVTLEGRKGASGESDVKAYHRFLQTLQVTEIDD
jgi:hypothetical protein